MRAGRPIAVVGPSGVGKDTVMAAVAVAARSRMRIARRVITRPCEAGGEDHEGIARDAFAARTQAGDFALWWHAHGLGYGIPATVRADLAAGHDVLMNLSRGVLGQAQATFDDLIVLSLTAPRAVLAARLAARGREDAAAIDRRLDRAVRPLPDGLNTHEIANDGPLADTVGRVLTLLYPVRA